MSVSIFAFLCWWSFWPGWLHHTLTGGRSRIRRGVDVGDIVCGEPICNPHPQQEVRHDLAPEPLPPEIPEQKSRQEISNILGNLTSITLPQGYTYTYSLNCCPTLSIRRARSIDWGRGHSNAAIEDLQDFGPQHTSKPGFTPLPASTAGVTLELTRVFPSPKKSKGKR